MKRWFVLAALGIAGCGGSELQNVSATVSAQQKCPKSIAPGPRAAAQASKALYAALPRLYPTLNRKGATVQGMFGLGGGCRARSGPSGTSAAGRSRRAGAR